jgi:hypothetical protein
MKTLLSSLIGLLIGAGVVTYYMPAHKYQGKTAEKWAEEAEINKVLYQAEQKRAFACEENPSSAACNPFFNEAEYSPTPTPIS